MRQREPSCQFYTRMIPPFTRKILAASATAVRICALDVRTVKILKLSGNHLTYALPLSQLLYETRCFHFLHKAGVDKGFWIRRRRFGILQCHIVEQGFDSRGISVRNI